MAICVPTVGIDLVGVAPPSSTALSSVAAQTFGVFRIPEHQSKIATRDTPVQGRHVLAASKLVAIAALAGASRTNCRPRRSKAAVGQSVQRVALKAEFLRAESAPEPRVLFDPMGLFKDKDEYDKGRDLEVALGRFAMLGTIGVITPELYHNAIAQSIGLPSGLAPAGQVPTVFNGGIDMPVTEIIVFVSVMGLLAAVGEKVSLKQEAGYDPLNPEGLNTPTLSPVIRFLLGEAQRINGRVAMVAIICMGAVETITSRPVVAVTPLLFGA